MPRKIPERRCSWPCDFHEGWWMHRAGRPCPTISIEMRRGWKEREALGYPQRRSGQRLPSKSIFDQAEEAYAP